MANLQSTLKRLSLAVGILLLASFSACGGGGGVSIGGGGGDIGGGSGITITDDGDDGGGELAPGGGGGTPVAVEIPALGDVNNLPFVTGEVVGVISNSLSAQLSTGKSIQSVQSLQPQAATSPPDGGILLSGEEEFEAGDSMTACATAQQWQSIWKKNSQTNDLALCKIKASVQQAEDNDVDPYDGNYHILTTDEGSKKIRFRVIRDSSNLIQRLEFFACQGSPSPIQESYSLYTVSGRSITIYTKYYSQAIIDVATPPNLYNEGNIATLTGTLYEADPTTYTAKNLVNLHTRELLISDGSTYSASTRDNAISALTQGPSSVLIDEGTYEYREVDDTTTTYGLYSSADISNPSGINFNPANYRMFQGAGVLTDADLIKSYYGYADNYVAQPDSLSECWNNDMLSIECLDSNSNYLAVNGHTPRDPSNASTEEFATDETWNCSGTADIPQNDTLYTSCTDAMDASFVSTIACKDPLKGYAATSLLLESDGSGYPAGEAPVMHVGLSHGETDGVFGFSEDYIPDPVNEYTACDAADCGLTSIGFRTAEGPAFSLEILEQPGGILCQVSGGNGLYYGFNDELNDTGAPYIKCTDCPGGVCPSVTSSDGMSTTKMVMYSSDYGIDGFIGFSATDVRARADNICRYSSQLPANCGAPHAFMSISAGDDIANMPANFGFSDALQIVSMTGIEVAEDWLHIVGGLGVAGLTNSLTTAGVTTHSWWSGSDVNGAFDSDSCSGWTSRNTDGVIGSAGSVGIFISDSTTACDKAQYEDYMLLCICPNLITPE